MVTGASEESVLALVSYCLSSILMTVFNKYVLSSHGFLMNFFFLLVQFFINIFKLCALKFIGLLNYKK